VRISGAVRRSSRRSMPRGQSRGAATAGPLLLVHHGLFWGDDPGHGMRYRRLKGALDGDVPLYSATCRSTRIRVGNNVLLAGLLASPSPDHSVGTRRSMSGSTACSRRPRRLTRELSELLVIQHDSSPEDCKNQTVRSYRWAGSSVREAAERGCELSSPVRITHTWFDAMERGVNLIYAGHGRRDSGVRRWRPDRAGVRPSLGVLPPSRPGCSPGCGVCTTSR